MTSLWDPNYVATSTSLKFLRKTHTVFYYVIRWQNKPYGIDQISSNEHRNKWHLMKENVFMKNQKKNHQLWNSYEWETLVTNVNFELKSDKWCIYVFFVPSSKGTMVIFPPIPFIPPPICLHGRQKQKFWIRIDRNTHRKRTHHTYTIRVP